MFFPFHTALKANTSLVALDLSGCSISNEGIPHLCEFTQLEALWLFNTNLNQEGIARLSCLKKVPTTRILSYDLTNLSLFTLVAVPRER